MPPLIPVLVTVVALGLAVAHVAAPGAAIDGTTVALLGIAALPWLGSIFKTIELPGGIKAEYRDRLAAVEQQVAQVQRALIHGASADLGERLSAALDTFALYLTNLGFDTGGALPEVTFTDVPEGYLASYDAEANRIAIDPRLADDPALTLHEYAHRVLLRARGRVAGMDPVERSLAAYFVAAFQGSARLYADSAVSRQYGLDTWQLDRTDHVGDVQWPTDAHARGFVWAQVLWDARGRAEPDAVDRAVADTWRTSDGDDEEAYAAAFARALDGLAAGLGGHFLDRLAATGLVARAG